MKRVLRRFVVLTVAMIVPVTVAAQQNQPKTPWGAKAEEKAKSRQEAKAKQRAEQRRKWRAAHHDRDANGRPPGRNRGQKAGWDHRGVPPGQVKPVNERHEHWYRRHHRDHDRDRDHRRFHDHREHDRDHHEHEHDRH